MSDTTPSSFNPKPPNVIIYTGREDKERNFDLIRTQLNGVFSRDSYTVYVLDDRKILGSPWSKHSVLLVIYNNGHIDDKILNEFKFYAENGGHILSVGCGGHGLIDGVELKELHFSCPRTCMIEVNTESLDVPKSSLEVDCEPFYFTGKGLVI